MARARDADMADLLTELATTLEAEHNIVLADREVGAHDASVCDTCLLIADAKAALSDDDEGEA